MLDKLMKIREAAIEFFDAKVDCTWHNHLKNPKMTPPPKPSKMSPSYTDAIRRRYDAEEWLRRATEGSVVTV